MTIIDTMPPTSEDYRLDSWCRIRVYTPPGKPVVIVATDVEQNERVPPPDLIGRVFRSAFTNAGKPIGAILIEHHTGMSVTPEPQNAERWAEVTFLPGFSLPNWLPLRRSEVETFLGKSLI